MILSDRDIESRLITDPAVVESAMTWWDRGEWEKVGANLIIQPYNYRNLGVCSYDLSVGNEYISLRDPKNVKGLASRQRLPVAAGETILIITKEDVRLPRTIMAVVVPRARRLFEGTAIATCRIEPTWYGKLIIAFTNFTKGDTWLLEGEPFCTCFFIETNEVRRSLEELGIGYLGRKDVQDLTFEHLEPETILSKDQVTLADIDRVVEQHGKPWDIIRGGIARTRDEIQAYIVTDAGPNITREATNSAVRHAFRRLEIQVWAFIGILGTALLSFVGVYAWYLITR